MTKLSINNFNANEITELELFAQKHMQDTNSATNGDSLRMGLSLKVINNAGLDVYLNNSKYIQDKIDIIYNNLSTILEKK